MAVARLRGKFSNGHSKNNGPIKPNHHRHLRTRKRFPVRYIYLVATIFALGVRFTIFRKPGDEYYENLYQQALATASSYIGSGASLEKASAGGDDTTTTTTLKDNKCTIPRFHIDDKDVIGLGSKVGPVVLEGWDFQKDAWTPESLIERAGDLPQYLKDLTVQPYLKNAPVHDSQRGLRKTTNNKQPGREDMCVLKTKDVLEIQQKRDDVLFFTNDKENKPFMNLLSQKYKTPKVVNHIHGFRVFSAFGKNQYHSMHAHGESWLGQVHGRRMWWFLPPGTNPKPKRVDACGYLNGKEEVPANVQTCIQNPGEIIWFPKDWFHATCALDDWNAGIGAQAGETIRQNFFKLPSWNAQLRKATTNGSYEDLKQKTLEQCGLSQTKAAAASPIQKEKQNDKTKNKKVIGDDKDWKWFDGDLNAYYNSLEEQIHDRDPSKLASYAVHRWMGPKRSTEEHYELIDRAIQTHHSLSSSENSKSPLRVFDGGCGLGSALMFFEARHPDWQMTGNTISEEQQKFIDTKLPKHNFHVNLKSYDEIEDGKQFDVIYSIEALIHSLNVEKTMKAWAEHLAPGGIVVIIDDYVAEGADKNDAEMQAFSKSWLANVLITPTEFEQLANKLGLVMVENRDLLKEYEIVKRNYRNHRPDIKPIADRTHQGWMGSKWRQRLTVDGKLMYNMIVLQKKAEGLPQVSRHLTNAPAVEIDTTRIRNDACAAVPSITGDSDTVAEFTEITPQLMSGRGKGGGQKLACISGWYCCNKGTEWFDHLDAHRTDNTAFLKLDRNLFGHYVDVFAKHLNEHYKTYPASATGGRFLDIGGTGSTSSGMTKVTSKFQHFAGPLEYWKLDVDTAAKDLERTLYCDIDDCPIAEDCGFDVTFSHTVLEHAKRPWKSFDTIARITKKGGLTMHLVPWSYQYHATPDDNYRFSHKALITLLEDRGFDVLEVGYDICNKPEKMKSRIDEHYDVIWLSYVVGRKR